MQRSAALCSSSLSKCCQTGRGNVTEVKSAVQQFMVRVPLQVMRGSVAEVSSGAQLFIVKPGARLLLLDKKA